MLEIYDRVIPSGSMPTLAALLVLAAGLYVFSGFLDVVRGKVLSRTASLIDARLSRRVLQVIGGASLKARIGGDVLRPAQEMDQIRSFLGRVASAALFDLPWMPVYLAVCFFLHPLIGWQAAAVMLILITLTIATDIFTRSSTQMAASAISSRNRFGEAAHRNAEAIAAMGMLEEVESRWPDAQSGLTALQRRTGDVASTFAGASKTLRQALQSGSLALGAYLVIQGDMSGGMIIAASITVARALQPIKQVIANWRNMVGARQAWQRLQDRFKLFPDAVERTALPAPTNLLAPDAVFAALPGERQRMTVQNVSFRVQAGTVVGVTGPSVSGKSSLVRTITGVWSLTRGKVSLDGTSDQWPAHERGKHISYMPQSSDLFPGTIAENIARLNPSADDSAIVTAARAASVHDMIVALADGYETQVGDGGLNLSAGQRQRAALARALYGDPFLVVLDEPNSNLNADGDKALAVAINAVKRRGGVVIVVAHRNSVLAQIDLLLVMENGVAKAFGARRGTESNPATETQAATHDSLPKPDGDRRRGPTMTDNTDIEDSLWRSLRRNVIAGTAGIAVLFGGVGGWAATTELSGAVIANGILVVDGNVKKVQNPTGGIVAELLVKEGQSVIAGETIVRLDATVTRANLVAAWKSLNYLYARQARLETERDGLSAVETHPLLRERLPAGHAETVMTSERRLFADRLVSRDGQKARLREQVQQLREQIGGLGEQSKSKSEGLKFIEKELDGLRRLFEIGGITMSQVNALERNAARLRGERGQLIASIASAMGSISEIELQLLQVDQAMRAEVAAELRYIENEQAKLIEQEVTALDQLKHIEIKASIGGTVHQLASHTVGGVITPAEVLMQIVPKGSALTVEDPIAPQDIDQQTGMSFYRTALSIPDEELSRLSGLALVPGMPVETFIRTGDRTVVSHLAKPAQDHLQRVFRQE